MASPAIELDAGGRALRVSNPDRVIFPAAGGTPEISKRQVVEYYLAVEDGIMRALRERPTTLERWPKGVHEGIVLSTREKGGGDAFFQTRVPRGAPDYLETAKVFDMLLAVPKYGRVKANKVLQQVRISPSKTIGGLSDRQRTELVALLRARLG